MSRHSLDELSSIVDRPFEQAVVDAGHDPITANRPEVLQLNLGYLCNQACRHCHHQAGPDRTELMSREVMEAAVAFANLAGIAEFDLTGGAPELNPNFRWLVERLSEREARIIERCNLTVLEDPCTAGIAEFLARHGVSIIASLPCYEQADTDEQRGAGVYEASIRGLRTLNALGYGLPGSDLDLLLVYNPGGPSLPPNQAMLEQAYRERLRAQHGVEFTHLLTLANIPCGRFARSLHEEQSLTAYMVLLQEQFAAANLSALMCRSTLSVRWDGRLYDCDFNQSLDLPIRLQDGTPANIRTVRLEDLLGRRVLCLDHCYGCTAGQGSSCGGALTQ